MTTDELNAIVKAVMDELEKAGVDFDFKAETPQPDDLVYVMRGTADKYQGITVKWQNLLDIIVQKATEARDDAISAKDIALQTLATIQSIESNVSTMKSSVDASEANVASMKASVETSEANVTQMKSNVSEMKTSVEGTKSEVEGLKSDVTALKSQTQTIVDNAKDEVTGLLGTKVNYSDSLTYEEIMATNADLTNKVSSASALLKSYNLLKRKILSVSESNTLNLDEFREINTFYTWTYATYQYVTSKGSVISRDAGVCFNIPNLLGVVQIFIPYNNPTIKVRTIYDDSYSEIISDWVQITTTSSSI